MVDSKNSSYVRYSWFLLGMVFLVILAGGIVRMTQSGMGCPDWPKCFGMWIPPIHESQLPPDFEKYLSKQDIDHSFNVYHTWIEYINRLLGALLGVFIFIYAIWTSIKFSRDKTKMSTSLYACLGLAVVSIISAISGLSLLTRIAGGLFFLSAIYALFLSVKSSNDRPIMITSILLLIAVGIQGWLGKIVVDENLAVVKITIHMVGALVIAALPLYIITRSKKDAINVSKPIAYVTLGMIFVVLMQIILGTQVREEIDTISKALDYESRSLWIERLSSIFILHRSFSWLVLGGAGYLFWKGGGFNGLKKHVSFIFMEVVVIIVLGVVMAYLDMPAIAQPLHLLLACILIIHLIYTRLRLCT